MKKRISPVIVVTLLLFLLLLVFGFPRMFPHVFSRPKTLEQVAKLNQAIPIEYSHPYPFITLDEKSDGSGWRGSNLTFTKAHIKKEFSLQGDSFKKALVLEAVGDYKDVTEFMEYRSGLQSYDSKGKSHGNYSYGVYDLGNYDLALIFLPEEGVNIDDQKYYVLSGFLWKHLGASSIVIY